VRRVNGAKFVMRADQSASSPASRKERNTASLIDSREHGYECESRKSLTQLDRFCPIFGFDFLNGSSVLPYMTRPPPRPGNPSWSSHRFWRLIANNF
jgi:hypothetical protein